MAKRNEGKRPAAETSRPVGDRTLRRLLVAALAARQRAYAPYSEYMVGAALLGDDGRVYAGCNVENASYPACLCAERNAVGQAVARGARQVRALALVTPSIPPAPPCGMCLQVLAELAGPELPILLATPDGDHRSLTLGDLLPYRFELP